MLFSVITVTRNNRAGLAATAASITAQTCRDFEWIIIDGASSDGTQDDLDTFPARMISEADRGPYDAMNKGLDMAQGDYVIFMNAGDQFSDAETLEKINAALPETLPGFIYGDAYEDDQGENFYKPAKPHGNISRGLFTHHQAMLYKRSALHNLRYNLSYKIAADYEFTAKFLHGKPDILYLPFALCIFASGGMSQKNTNIGRAEQFLIRRDLKLCSLAANLFISGSQFLTTQLRHFFPQLYWLIREIRR